ncbi:MAG: CHAT domain-containing protein, partial [Cyanobacteria bacterium P01_A01_bin.135]
EAAIAAYGAAFKSLDGVRQDLVGIDAEVQFSFESNISPLYRELADLLLSPSAGEPVTPEDLDQAISVLDLLQRVELENYLRCNLSQTLQISETAIDPTAAIIYPIVLPERLEVIAILPDGSRRHYTQPVGSKAVKALAQQIKQDTLKPFISAEGEARSQQLYNWLISPVQADLAAAQIRTLVFVLGSVLRDVPLAALYNGHHYLIEDYAVAIAPGLQLVRPAPLQAVDPEVLAFGLSEMQPDLTAHAGFSDLQYVAAELQEIEAQVDSQQFINAAFNTGNFAAQVQALPFPIIHLATHGQFSSDPEQTFILTWNKRLNIDQISQIFRQRDETTSDPVELLVLSACETATGDRRAALGLAGIAVQSGARSTIASLWQVDDRAAAELMSGLYAQLSQPQETISRAEALRQAQLALLKSDRYRVPAFWAAFMLVGNWL